MSPLPVPYFDKGDKVEVMKQVNGPNTLTYFEATVLGSPSRRKAQIWIEYNCLMENDYGAGIRIKEMVNFACLRPKPPKMLHERFNKGDSVDVFCDKGWQKGTVKESLENSKFVVGFDGTSEGIVVEQSKLRLHQEWDDGLWTPPFIENNKTSSDSDMKPKKVRIKIKSCRREPETESIFKTRARVEVRSDEEGYIGAWFDATIVEIVGNDKYLVKYLNLLTDDETAFVKEMVSDKDIRPCPPLISADKFEQFDNVDVWFNDGWWAGVVSEVVNKSEYMVYFSTSNETMKFAGSLLRHHQEWIDGKWIKKEKSMKMEDSKRNPREKFSKGTKVEVRSDEVGFQGAWFAATIVDEMENDKFVIQYHGLLTEDGTDLLKEEANGSDIRPIPPSILCLRPFALLEMVDAWYNEGWWVGRITRLHKNSKYTVHFMTNEEMAFEHSQLRPHQDYIDGNWATAPKDWL
ncbi:protein AGENET DOMAIN (AGD)-CONTAINING P1-like [Euphorbia lathyris]|uniref:protein AGENET DOMAIN (AGD)-CONTAINING P1-like n=1 Tax=Euphorbia lathyris TaxID=212925 RepID=UPI00331419C3